MVVARLPQGWTVEAYLEMEERSEVRHEFIAGHVYALAGGTRAHSRIAGNTITALGGVLHGGPCGVDTSDLKVRVDERHFLYPDASVGCDPLGPSEGRRMWTDRPAAIVEVLSPSTAEYDAGAKFEAYARLISLRDYVLISSDQQRVEVRSRLPDTEWQSRTFGPGELVELPGLGVRVAVDRLYDGVTFDEAGGQG